MSTTRTVPALLLLAVGTLGIGVVGSIAPGRSPSPTPLERSVATPSWVAVPPSSVEYAAYPSEATELRGETPAVGDETLQPEFDAAGDVTGTVSTLEAPFPISGEREVASSATSRATAPIPDEGHCPVQVSDGAVLVDFMEHDTRPLRADGSRAEAERSAPLVLSEGSYTATIGLTRETEDSSRLDRVYLKFYDAEGVLIASTSPTRDLADGETEARERTSVISLERAASSVTVRHVAYADSSPHFLSVPCMLVVPVPHHEPTALGEVRQEDGGAREVSVVHERSEARVPENTLGTGTHFSVAQRHVPTEPAPLMQDQTAAATSAEVGRMLLPLTMLVLTIVGLLTLSLARPRA